MTEIERSFKRIDRQNDKLLAIGVSMVVLSATFMPQMIQLGRFYNNGIASIIDSLGWLIWHALGLAGLIH